MVMGGESRRYFHGVPTVLTEDAEDLGGSSGDASFSVFPELDDRGHLGTDGSDILAETADGSDIPSLEEMLFMKAFLRTVRMNMSIRKV